MEIRRKKVNNQKFEFINKYWRTGYAWGHKSTLLVNGNEWASVKVRYYNRTWESYTYQSAMFRVLEEYRDIKLKNFLENYLYSNGKNRFGKNEKAKLIKEFEKSEDNKTIKKIHKAIETRNFSK